MPPEVSDHAETSRHLRADLGAVLETVGLGRCRVFRPTVRFPPADGSANRDNDRLGMLLIGDRQG
jgi:hypothetical protein